MIHSKVGFRGLVTAPHHLAAQAGLSILREGGNAIEAMIAAASTIAVAYPHMNGLGGDGFWLIAERGSRPVGIQACGRAAAEATRQLYLRQGLESVPPRGPLAALTMAGTVSGWKVANDLSRARHGGRLPLARLLEDAIHYAGEGVAVSGTLAENAAAKLAELRDQPGFADAYLAGSDLCTPGTVFKQPRLARTLEQLSRAGLDDFYRGELARSMAKELEAEGSLLRMADFETHDAELVSPLAVSIGGHTVFNLPPPTQGIASLLILALYARVAARSAESADYIHRLVESTKAAFRVRDRYITDPAYMTRAATDLLTDTFVEALATEISLDRAAPWPNPTGPGDTVWLAAADGKGLCVSFIQSLYWEFGSGVVLPSTGITWQNRGTSFSLDQRHPNRLEPGRLPFHTIQPPMAQLDDGRLMAFGTMGGDGQPQTQAAIFTRYVIYGQPLQQAITAPRWLLGRTWGQSTTNLKLESRFAPHIVEGLAALGHDVELVSDFAEIMGHAGAIVRHPDGLLEGAGDPRSDGAVAVC